MYLMNVAVSLWEGAGRWEVEKLKVRDGSSQVREQMSPLEKIAAVFIFYAKLEPRTLNLLLSNHICWSKVSMDSRSLLR
jgi:hypothetical protein